MKLTSPPPQTQPAMRHMEQWLIRAAAKQAEKRKIRMPMLAGSCLVFGVGIGVIWWADWLIACGAILVAASSIIFAHFFR